MTKRYIAVAGDQETLNEIPNHGNGTYPLIASNNDLFKINGVPAVLQGQPFPAHCGNASAASSSGGSSLLKVGGVPVARIGDVSTHPTHTCYGIFGSLQDLVTVDE